MFSVFTLWFFSSVTCWPCRSICGNWTGYSLKSSFIWVDSFLLAMILSFSAIFLTIWHSSFLISIYDHICYHFQLVSMVFPREIDNGKLFGYGPFFVWREPLARAPVRPAKKFHLDDHQCTASASLQWVRNYHIGFGHFWWRKNKEIFLFFYFKF